MWLPEIKVIDTDEPLLILGNDLLAPEQLGDWEWLDIGRHPLTKQGHMIFWNGVK